MRGIHHLTAKICIMQHCTANAATANTLFKILVGYAKKSVPEICSVIYENCTQFKFKHYKDKLYSTKTDEDSETCYSRHFSKQRVGLP